MDVYKLHMETIRVVLYGQFNPSIFQPLWMASKNLIGEEEAKQANIQVIHSTLAQFSIDDWLSVRVTKNSAYFEAPMAFNPALRDFVTGIFSILKETPLDTFHFDCFFEILLLNDEMYDKFGNFISPLDIWKEYTEEPELQNIIILDKKNGKSFDIRPSNIIKRNGITLLVTNHSEIKNAIEFIDYLNLSWDETINNSQVTMYNLMDRFSLCNQE